MQILQGKKLCGTEGTPVLSMIFALCAQDKSEDVQEQRMARRKGHKAAEIIEELHACAFFFSMPVECNDGISPWKGKLSLSR